MRIAKSRELAVAGLALIVLAAPAPAQRVVLSADKTARLSAAVPPPGGPAVGGLRFTASATTINLRWSCPPGTAGFDVYVTPKGAAAPIKLTSAPINPNCPQDLTPTTASPPTLGAQQFGTAQTTYSAGFTHAGLDPGAELTYFVRALYANGGPADSPPIVAHTVFPPVAFTLRVADAGSVTVDWPRLWVNGIETSGYVVSRKLQGETAFRQIAAVPANLAYAYSYVDRGVPVGRHEYAVQAVDGVPGTPLQIATGVPALYNANTVYLVQVSLSWNGVWPNGIARVMSSASPAGPFADVTAQGVASGGTWRGVGTLGLTTYYKIIATYPGGVATESAAHAVSIPAPAIGGLTATDQGNVVRLRWNCEPGTQEYWIMRRAGGAGAFAFLTFPNGGVLHVFPIIKSGMTVAECSYDDAAPARPAGLEYVVIGFAKFEQPVRAAQTRVDLR